MINRHFLGANNITSVHRRPRSEKKPIPDDQKDEKYYERRKRNNQAAKKSRDARKIREDNVSKSRVILLQEQENIMYQIVKMLL